MANTRRTKRIADLITREISGIVQREVKDPRIGLVTFTGAEVSSDLSSAKVFYSVLGDEKQREDTQIGLDRAKGYIRREIAQRLNTKTTPNLRFVYDNSMDRAIRLEELLEQSRND
jgi:ribosome-binding factor A